MGTQRLMTGVDDAQRIIFLCAACKYSTRTFPQILDISSGTNVCGGVTSASGASLASGHRTPIYAVCSE